MSLLATIVGGSILVKEVLNGIIIDTAQRVKLQSPLASRFSSTLMNRTKKHSLEETEQGSGTSSRLHLPINENIAERID